MVNQIEEADMHVLVIGGAGYVGSLLCPLLLERGWRVSVFDICWFGSEFLPLDHPNMRLTRGDIRDTAALAAAMRGVDVALDLACVSNDASFELDEALSTSINLHAFEPMVIAAKQAGVKRFVYASSSSVYGVSDAPDVTEDHPLKPLTLYNKYKGLCEPMLLAHTDADFTGVIFRPATVCGYAPRQRLDLSVNILTAHAVMNNRITVFGGAQMRPNLHIRDYCDAALLLMTAPKEKVADRIYNVGFQNMSIADLARLVKREVETFFPDRPPVEIVSTPTDDIRSYHINSDRIARELGFRPRRDIGQAVRDLCAAFAAEQLPEALSDDGYYNVRTLKRAGAR